MTTKNKISKALLKKLDAIDKKHGSGKITNRQHDNQSKTAVDKALGEVK